MKLLAADLVEKAPAGVTTEILEVHVDAGQRRAGRLGHDFPVVEADDRNAVGHDDAALAERVGGAASDLVVAAEQRLGRPFAATEQLCHRLAAPAFRPDAGQVEPLRFRQPGGGKRLAVAVTAQPHGLETFGPGDVGDPPPAEIDQVPRGERRAAFVVRQQAIGLRIVGLREDVDHRNLAARQLELGPPVGAPGGHNDPVDALADQRFDMVRLAVRVVGGVAHEDRHAAVGQALLQPLHDRHGETAEAVGRDQADGQALAAMQALSQVVGPKADLAGDPDHAVAGLLAEAAIVVERLRGRADADGGEPGDIADGRPRLANRLGGRRRVGRIGSPAFSVHPRGPLI